MTAVVGSLAVELLADNAKLEKGLTAAGHDVTKFERKTNKNLGRMDRRFDRSFTGIGRGSKVAFGGLAAGAIGALAPILSVTAAISGAKAALTEWDEIGKRSKAAGLTAEQFQEMAYAANLGGVETDAFAKGMEQFARTVGQAEGGTGRLITTLKTLDPVLLSQLKTATTQRERLDLVADALDRQTDQAKKAAIANALFGSSGVRMIEVLKGGSKALAETAKKAKALSIVVDNSLIANAESMNDKFTTASRVIDVQFKSALINLAPVIVSTARLVGTLAKDLNIVLDQFKSLDDATFIRPLQNDLVAIENERYRVKQRIKALENSDAGGGIFGNILKGSNKVELDAAKRNLDDLTDRALALQDRISELQGRGQTPPKPLDIPDVPNSGTGNSRASAALKQADAVAKLVDQLHFEQAQLGRTADEQELYNALKSAGVERESEYGQAIEAALTPLQRQKAAIEANKKAMDEFGDLAKSTLSTFASDLEKGKSFTDALADSFKNLASRLLDIALDNSITSLIGGLSGAFGFGGGFAPATTGLSTGLPLSFAGGGYTGNGPRSGGVDGIGGFPAIVHPRESIVDHTVVGTKALSKLEISHKTEIEITGGEYRETSRSSKNQAGIRVDKILVEPIQQSFADGHMDGLMRNLYGLQRRGH